MRKTLIIGSGNLSSSIQANAAKYGWEIDVIRLRNLKKELLSRLQDSVGYENIIYLGYDRYNLLKNIIYFNYFIQMLKKHNFTKKVIFFNSQIAYLDKISKDSLPSYDLLTFDRYQQTKRMQLKILQRSKLNHVNIILPIVYGKHIGQDEQFKFLASDPNIKLPHKGENNFYFLHIDNFSTWLFEKCMETVCLKFSNNLLYSYYGTLNSFLTKNYSQSLAHSDFDYRNAYNLPKIALAKHILIRSIKSVVAVFYYLFSDKYLKNDTIGRGEGDIVIPPDILKFYALNFFNPVQIKSLNVSKI